MNVVRTKAVISMTDWIPTQLQKNTRSLYQCLQIFVLL